MIPVMFLVQEDQISAETEAALKSRIDGFSRRSFHERAEIDWIVVPAGSGFTGSKPSTAVIASLHANKPLEQETRTSLLKELCDIVMDQTGRTKNEVLAAIRNPQQ